jgi:predicted DNA repair protein MutK
MFLVGGGIVVHGIAPLHHAVEALAQAAGVLAPLVPLLLDALIGVAAGALVFALVALAQRLRSGLRPHPLS